MAVISSLKEAIQQLKDCKFTCEAGPLENNVAFQELEKFVTDHSLITHAMHLEYKDAVPYGIDMAVHTMD